MSELMQLARDGAFDASMTAAMGQAFEKACTTLNGGPQSHLIREIIASRIIELAREGRADPDLLCERALKSLGVRAD
jgi:hypothetical protein